MAGRRGKLHKPVVSSTSRRYTRRGKASQDEIAVPDVFQDLLYEEQASKAAGPDEDAKPLKKRKTTRSTNPRDLNSTRSDRRPDLQATDTPSVRSQSQSHTPLQTASQTPSPKPLQISFGAETGSYNTSSTSQTLQIITDSSESDDSDVEWEDALRGGSDSEENNAADAVPEIDDIAITIGGEASEGKKDKSQVRRRAITSIDKKRRLDIHKLHVLCLLYHVHRRNAFCNDEKVQATLRKILPSRILSNLVPNPEYSQYQASKRFIDGMNELKLLWSKRFSVTAQGMYKARWAEADADVKPFSDFDELDDPMDRDEFRKAASTLHGSQDLGAQLFCALLRAVGVEARLVCSLQCLPFASAAQPSTPQKPNAQKNTIVLDPYNKPQSPSPSKPKATTPSRPKRLSRLERALGERHPVLNTAPSFKPKKKYHNPYPVYWVEAFNAAQQKWVPIDPLSTFTTNAPEKLEPPLNFSQNSLVYAIAFEDDYTGKDVTRRYAKAYNAKTRKFRVECTTGGEKWWKRALNFFRRSTKLDRDQVEDATLARREAAEGIPKNVQDFKDHPTYVLERHLKHNEVIHPQHQVGKVNVGTSMNPKMEPIFRRKDVHVVKSADKWYRLGRDVRDGEQPLKHAKPKKGRRLSIPLDGEPDDQQDEIGAGLYADFQTELYVPPPVVRGRVPRNAYGNLDVYVPSMIPSGGVHIRHKLASKAARVVGVDYADAVTGFSFKGRHGTAVVQGVVVAKEYTEAVQAVLDAMEYAREEAENAQRRSEALRLWRRFYLGLRISERVNAIEIDGERGPTINVQEEIEREDKELAEKEFAGGFFLDGGEVAEPKASLSRHYEASQEEGYGGGGFMPDESGNEGGGFLKENFGDGGFIPEAQNTFGSTILAQQQLRLKRNTQFDGAFTPEEEEEEGEGEEAGGFMCEVSLAVAGPSSLASRLDGEFIPRKDTVDYGGGFIPEGELMANSGGFTPGDTPTKGELPSAGHEKDAPTPEAKQDVVMTEVSPEPSHFESSTKPDTITTASEIRPEPVKQLSLPPSSPSEAGSLPLEDPEDEDADPEWLVDVT